MDQFCLLYAARERRVRSAITLRLFSFLTMLPCLSLLLLFGGCGASQSKGVGDSNPAPTVTLAVNPGSVVAGAFSTLTATATNATQVTVAGGGNNYTLTPTGGTQSVSPSATTTYTVTATGPGGTTSSTATVNVMPPAPPAAPTIAIQASPTSVSAGGASTLTVTAANATQVTVTGSDKTSYTLQPTGGTPTVKPSATTTYTATATGPGGTISSTVTVTVLPPSAAPPSIAIQASPASITAGSSSLLTVTAANATQVTLTGSDGKSYSLSSSGGPQAVQPSANTTYTATATGPGGTISSTATVNVTPDPRPTVSISAQPSSIVAQGSTTLTVTSSYATQVTISGSDGSNYPLQSPDGGTQIVSPSTTTTYTATAIGPGGTTVSDPATTVTVGSVSAPTVTFFYPNPSKISSGHSAVLTWTASAADSVKIQGSDGSSYTNLPASGGSQSVSPSANTTYTVTATGNGASASKEATVAVVQPGTVNDIDHVVFMLQENHSFDNYFGMLNPYRAAMGWNVGNDGKTYTVDGIDDKLSTSNTNDQNTVFPLFKFTSTCIDDESSAWLESYGDVNRYDFSVDRSILMDGFVHNAEGFENSCKPGNCTGGDTAGKRAMGYYDQDFLNYYYYMASQFALSDRWFSPVSSKSISNRIATFTGGTTQGLTRDPGNDDQLSQLSINNIFEELDQAHVSWKIYYTVTQGYCLDEDDCQSKGPSALYPATNFSSLSYSYKYLHENPASDPKTGYDPNACAAPTQPSSVVGDTSNSFCVDPDHFAPLSQYYKDLNNNALSSFSFIEAGYGQNDEHPGSQQSVLTGQQEMAKVLNAFMSSPEWKDSVFFLSYDEGGGPYDHVPPVPGHSNDNTAASQNADYPDISSVAVNPDGYAPCVPKAPGDLHCDLGASDPGAVSTDAPAVNGFDAQLGFRVPNMVISPFTRQHYVSHVPMDHTGVIKFVENRFIPGDPTLTAHDAAEPDLQNFFDFTGAPWATPPTPPLPNSSTSSCTPASIGP